MIVGNVIGSNPITPKVYNLVTTDGQEIPAILVDEETLFTATSNDIRQGLTAGTEEGVTTGEKIIPSYHTYEGVVIIMPSKELIIDFSSFDIPYYDYTKLQAIICSYNSSLANSVSAQKVSINGSVYDVNSTTEISVITKDTEAKTINFEIVNETNKPYILRYFTYKEIE